MSLRRQLPFLGVSLLAGYGACKGPFLTQVDAQTWVFGNDHWNVTEGKYYATKLFSSILPGHDLVGAAAGHYAGIGEQTPTSDHETTHVLTAPKRRREQLRVDQRLDSLPGRRLHRHRLLLRIRGPALGRLRGPPGRVPVRRQQGAAGPADHPDAVAARQRDLHARADARQGRAPPGLGAVRERDQGAG